MLFSEKSGYDDGLFQRFLICAPDGPLVPSKQIRRSGDSILSIHCLFYLLRLIHYQSRRNYTFTDDAIEFIDTVFDSDRQRTHTASQTDSFLGYIFNLFKIIDYKISFLFTILVEYSANHFNKCYAYP